MGGYLAALTGSGNNVYGQLYNTLTNQMINSSGLETYNPADWSAYSISMPEQTGSGRYILAIPGYVPAGAYLASYFTTGDLGVPTLGDAPFDYHVFGWDGGNIIWGGSGVNVTQINGVASAAAKLSKAADLYVPGVAVAGTLTSSQMTTDLPAIFEGTYAGRVLYFTSGANLGRAALITAYAVTGGKLTFLAFGNNPISTPPTAGDLFLIV